LTQPARTKKTSAERWAEMSPPERLVARAKAVGHVLAEGVAMTALVGTGCEVFHLFKFAEQLLDPTRAQDVFATLCGYYGIPLFFGGGRSIWRG
jgi:hypothetical protein